MERIPVFIDASDPISRTGITAQLQGRPEVQVIDRDEGITSIALVVVEVIDEDALRVVRAVERNGHPRVVLVVGRVDDGDVLSAVEAGASVLVRRSEATPEALVAAVRSAAAGEGRVPPDLLGRFMSQVGRLQRQVLEPRGITLAGLAQREIEVLKLIAEGLTTGEIATRLSYSERTIKNVIHDVVTRLQLRNRSHAVAVALREGLI
jgi:DNA-binding NarL/FixJ family response regulator